MAVKSQSYDHPSYIARNQEAMGECGGAATTQYAKFNAFTTMQAYNAVITVTVAGTAAGALAYVSKISGTATTVLGTATPTTSVAGTVLQIPLSTVPGGLSLIQGDILAFVTGADAAMKAAVTYEVSIAPAANITV